MAARMVAKMVAKKVVPMVDVMVDWWGYDLVGLMGVGQVVQ